MSNDRRIKFLARNLPFPTDPTYREYRVVEDLTRVTAEQIMTGSAGIWMLPVLAIVAVLRAEKNVSHETLDKILDLGPGDITLEGDFGRDEDEVPPSEEANNATGTPSTPETPEVSGILDSPTTSQEQPEGQTT